MKSPFGSLITAMVTPFTAAGGEPSIDLETTRRLAARIVDGGADGVVVCGSTGEGPTVSFDELASLVEAIADEIADRASIIVNIGTNSTATTLARVRDVASWPIDGLMVVVPFYNKPPQEGIYEHFAAIAEQSAHPIVAYNIPSRTGVNMGAETTLRLARAYPETFAAIKEASGDMDQVQAIIDGAPAGFCLYSGDDEATLEIVKRGGAGVISTIGNIAPGPMKALVEAAIEGDFDRALSLHESLRPVMRGLFDTTNPILVKEALRLRGLRSAALRLPLVSATAVQSEKLAMLMEKVEVDFITLE